MQRLTSCLNLVYLKVIMTHLKINFILIFEYFIFMCKYFSTDSTGMVLSKKFMNFALGYWLPTITILATKIRIMDTDG